MRGRVFRWGLPLLLVGVTAVAVAMGAMAATASTHAQSGTVHAAKSASFGLILAGANGRTLYRYTVDSKGVNRCSGNATCSKFWPPLLVNPGVKPTAGSGVSTSLLGTIKAPHGMRQVTYAGFPLYFFVGDKSAGQTKGQGFESNWYVVSGKGAVVKHQLAGSAAATTPASTTTGSTWG